MKSRAIEPRTEEGAPVAPHEKAPERRRKELIVAARTEFAEHGFAGARVQRIADRTNSNKALLYGYFGSKQGLYLAVLEGLYEEIRSREAALNLHELAPCEALEKLVAFTFRYYVDNPDFVAILSNENLLGARSLRQSNRIRAMNVPIVEALTDIIRRGQKAGLFRLNIDVIDLYISVSALGFMYIANRRTLCIVFGRDLMAPLNLRRRLVSVTQMVMRSVEA
jgi:AcrR family transcriptional regulator